MLKIKSGTQASSICYEFKFLLTKLTLYCKSKFKNAIKFTLKSTLKSKLTLKMKVTFYVASKVFHKIYVWNFKTKGFMKISLNSKNWKWNIWLKHEASSISNTFQKSFATFSLKTFIVNTTKTLVSQSFPCQNIFLLHIFIF